MRRWLLLLALLVGCVAAPVPVEMPVVLEHAPPPRKVYICDPGRYGNFMIVGPNVFLVMIRPDGQIFELCAIPANRLIIVGSPKEEA